MTMVSMVTASSPRLYTNRHGHSVAQPTASAVGHMKVHAIVSPTQAWGCHLAGGNATSLLQSVSSPQCSLSLPLCLA